jgi:hypothetical protein
MAWYDALSSHKQVAHELAEHVVHQWDMEHGAIHSPDQWNEAVELTTEHLQQKHEKGLIVKFLDAFVRN